MSLVPGTRFGCYEIQGPLGAGGMGEVYRAHDTTLHRDVALKALPDLVSADPERLARLDREAQILAAINHPPSPHRQLYGVVEAGGVRGLVLELIDGPTLAARIADGPVPLEQALAIGLQIAEALEAAHERGIVHRHLKPANIKVSDDGRVKVLDFGLAKALDAHPSGVDEMNSPTVSLHGTHAGVILGTAAYMAPEQAMGRAVDRHADVWAFGVVLYEMLTGVRPFEGRGASETLAAIIKSEPNWDALPSLTPFSHHTTAATVPGEGSTAAAGGHARCPARHRRCTGVTGYRRGSRPAARTPRAPGMGGDNGGLCLRGDRGRVVRIRHPSCA